MNTSNKKTLVWYNGLVIIDFHTHIFPSEVRDNREEYIKRDPCFAELYSSPKAKMATAEELIASMDQSEVDVSVVLNIGWSSQEICVQTNDYILESMARFPERLVGFCSVPMESSAAALDEVERCAKAGARGIGEVRPQKILLAPENSQALKPMIDIILQHQMILLMHTSEPVGHAYSGKGDLTPEAIYSFVTYFPEVNLVCAHWGGGLPFYTLMPEVARAINNVYFDTAASPYLYRPQIYSQAAQLIGAKKILFGSDFPLISSSRYIKEINATELSCEEKRLILGGNAQKLLGFNDKGK